ncbi:ATP-dependent helicase/deoxyribonuclease, subunit B [Gottschalkia acidurici 9a]|uniref:ATP-dependent helicase/deoxyribonuclease subunit B n=1 Tax=Gottschalkia acidurici (strain ATCC 7906 / DSM 604 / BCRC 14475 / CIP 104303 / KCTC 5404 / NCIMB 10678 / 9a) TaxID=1128398 RepID=K0B1X4_GOTA9|nr:helicase-exonuclease AddAB subunit AddB [Gottschalkia acidurici]AFS78915.1 ATP-dependent helicase/deoxyribonuclease, subunit B [Gottschalkia acidurici 9a]
MKVRYILGRSGTGKTHRVYEEIKYRLEESDTNKLILLVPEQFTLQGEADLISKMNLDGIMRLEVLSFSTLGFKVLNEVGGIKKIPINELGKIMILRKLFEENSGDLEVFKKGFNQEGFLKSFCSLVSEFKKNSVSIEELQTKINSFEKDNMLKRKLKDISLIYEKFNQYLEGSYTDEDDNLNLVIERLEQSNYFNDAEIWVDGFSTFSTQEYQILEKLFLKTRKVNISLTLDVDEKAKDYDLFEPTLDTYKRIRELATRNGIKETKTVLERNYNDKSKDILHLEREFFSYPYQRYSEKLNHINIFSGVNQYTEIENVAINIISLVREKNYRWRDIALVCNSLDIYTPNIKRVFNEYEIPYFLDEKRNIMGNPIIKFLISSLEIISRNFRYEDVFKCVKTGLSDLDKYEYEKLENYVLEFGIKGNSWLEDFKYINVKDEEDREKIKDELNEIRVKFVTPFISLKNKLKTKNKVIDTTRYIFEFLTEMKLESKIETIIELQKQKGNLDYVNENTQIWNTIMEIFDQLVEILGDTNISLKEYIKILESGLSNHEIGIIPPTMDQVLIGNLERSKSQDIKALFVVGVNDGILPSGFNDGGIILDDEKVIMQESGIELYSDNATRSKQERLSIYSAFTKPSQYLYISYALGDIEGRALRPSTLIDRFKKVFNITIESDVIKSDEISLKLISRPHSTFKYLTENLREDLEENNISEIWWDVYSWYNDNKDWDEKKRLIIDGLFHANQEENMSQNYAKNLYDIPFKSSISRLETFANCPFSHFVKYGLKPNERKEYSVRMPDIGTLFHNSIENFSKQLTIENLNWNEIDRQKSDELVEKVLDRMIDNFQNGVLLSTHRYKYLSNKLKRVSKRAIWVLTEHLKSGEFIPLKHEIFFGDDKENGIPPIVIGLPNGEEIKLEGRIDRVDMLDSESGSYVKVIDYKSGNKRFSLSDVYYGLQIQLVVYMDAVLSNKHKLVKNDVYPAGAFYFKIDDPIIQTDEDNASVIEKEIHKELKMDGLVLKDINVIKALDNTIDNGVTSRVIPVTLKKDGEPSKNSSVFEKEDLDNLITHVKSLVGDIATEILKGKIKIEPCKNGNQVSCEYCEFDSICQFDTNFEDNEYNVLKKLKNEEVLKKVKQKTKLKRL